MELDKCETDVVVRLYALRGGLSALSVKYDQMRKIDGNFYEKLHAIADTAGGARYEAPQGTVEYANWLVGYGFENELNRRYNSIKKEVIRDDRSSDLYGSVREYRKDAIKKYFSALLHFIITNAILYFVLQITVFDGWEKISGGTHGEKALEGVMDYVILIIICLFALATLIASLVSLGKGIYNSRLSKRTKKKYVKYLNDLQSKQNSSITLFNTHKKIAQANIAKLPQVRCAARKVLVERNAIVNSLVNYCIEYYKAILQEFNPLLDERDWKNLDLVIYELETRRADSVKEALQLVDRELQTERIERTIGEATKAICYTVARGFNELQSTIKICCDRICDRLDNISSQLDGVMAMQAVQSIQLAGISGQLADLTDSVNVSNALQAKANETSAQLYNDVHALRYYS